ncbi:MAG: lipopolysaccharide biosynthesis protein [Dehalococcoidia bacterium]
MNIPGGINLIAYLRDPLRNNALFFMAANVTNSLIGFFFWTLAARLYTVEDIGKATALISAANLLILFAGLGMGIGVVRFLSEEINKNALINTSFTICAATALILSLIFILGIGVWSPALAFIYDNYLLIALFIVFAVFSVIQLLLSFTFIAFGAARYSFYQSLIVGIKVIILIFLIHLGITGMFASFALGPIIAVIITYTIFLPVVYPGYKFTPSFNRAIFDTILHFSLGNYFGECFKSLTGVLVPLIIINLLGAETNAYFYVAWMISGVFFTVSYSINYSLIAATAPHPEQLRNQIVKALRFALLILIPAIIIVYFAGGFILSLFGKEYAQGGLDLLHILIVSSIPVAVNEIYIAVYRIRKQIKPIILIYGFIALFSIGAGYILLKLLGLTGIGVAWLSAHCIMMMILTGINLKYIRSTTNVSNTP